MDNLRYRSVCFLTTLVRKTNYLYGSFCVEVGINNTLNTSDDILCPKLVRAFFEHLAGFCKEITQFIKELSLCKIKKTILSIF